MKTKFMFMLALFLCGTGYTFSQFAVNGADYYYYEGEKIPISLDQQRLSVFTVKPLAGSRTVAGFIPFEEVKIEDSKSVYDFSIITNHSGNSRKTMNEGSYDAFVSEVKANPAVVMTQPCFKTTENKEIATSNYLYIKLKEDADIDKVREIAQNYHLEVVERNQYMPLWVTLRCTPQTTVNCLAVANRIFETGLFAASVPDFLSDDLYCANDARFDDQWGLYNPAYPDCDISICDAWFNATGNGIIIAILDQGVDMTHQDLRANIYSKSYDTETGTSPSKVYGDHATHCAGIAAAVKDNGIQIAGVAPRAKIMSVSNTLYGTADSRMKRADGINWAWQNGAAVISNSWGSSVKFQAIDDAIKNALTKGRGGKGSLVCFASGNDYGGVAYPANCNPDILAVGAISSNGKRSSFSNYGSELDVVAPGDAILSTLPGNAIGNKSGTSMACPHVAGLVALLLENNPELTAKQANNIIERNTKKIGGYAYANKTGRSNGTWNNEMGYGLIDAAAVSAYLGPYSVRAIQNGENESEGIESREGITSLSADPLSAQAVVRFELTNPRNVRIMIRKMLGGNETYTYPASEDVNEITINTSAFSPGFYVVTLLSDDRVIDTGKLIKP